MANILERVKNFLTGNEPIEDPTNSDIHPDNVLSDFGDGDIYNTGAFFDNEFTPVFNSRDKGTILEAQKNKIMQYRNMAKMADVNSAIEEIVNEIIFSEEKAVLFIDIDEENEKIKKEIQAKFDKILKLLNIESQIYNMVRQSYVDGQLVIHCSFDKNLKKGIQKLKMLEPCYLYFDINTRLWKYHTQDNTFYRQSGVAKEEEYDREEVIRETFNLHEDQINLSYLEYAIKPANQLKILEDLLVPLRFSRSISRRVFNVDVGELQNAKAEQVMKEMQNKFRYKKFYNTDTGEISNQQHITSMVEDYWFANRSGGKGTTVDVLDETGNLGEMRDILYMQKKLYNALSVPSNRVNGDPDADKTFDFESTAVTKEDIKFYMFISRLRKVYINVIQELLKRELVSTDVMSLDDYNGTYKEKIDIKFVSESMFIEKMKMAKFQQKLDIYTNVQEYNGKLFPVEHVLKQVFKFDDEEIEENFKKIAAEKEDPKYADFYKTEEF